MKPHARFAEIYLEVHQLVSEFLSFTKERGGSLTSARVNRTLAEDIDKVGERFPPLAVEKIGNLPTSEDATFFAISFSAGIEARLAAEGYTESSNPEVRSRFLRYKLRMLCEQNPPTVKRLAFDAAMKDLMHQTPLDSFIAEVRRENY